MIICKRPVLPDDHLQEAGHSGESFARGRFLRMINNNNNNNNNMEGKEEEEEKEKEEEEKEKKFLQTGGHMGKVVQEVLADLKKIIKQAVPPYQLWPDSKSFVKI